ncbi:MAG TPA: DUF222 domain-containing protein [Jatrophihabitans sp.]|nr:DUF222 domain-containing protein [Jatrophihabitans sp.]
MDEGDGRDGFDLGRLASIDLASLDDRARIDALIALERQRSRLDALQQRLLALICADDRSAELWHVEEVGAALRLSEHAARNRLKAAEQLCVRLPATLHALSHGRLSPGQAAVITESSYGVPDERLAAFEQRVLARAGEQSLAQTRQSARRAQLAADPATAEVRHRQARADRHVHITPADDGMAWLTALLPAADAQAIHARIDWAARLADANDTTRTLDQRRADILVSGLLAGLDGAAPTTSGYRPAVAVTVSLSTLTGRDDEPGWLDNYGPIPAGYARELAHDPTGTWRRLITDPITAQLLDYGTNRYRPPRQLAEHIVARDAHCTFPFCSRPARHSDLDHVRPYPGGPTSAANLQPLHRRHHNAKTHGGWRSSRDHGSGVTTWISPQGRRYDSRPPQRWKLPDDPPFRRGGWD